MKALVVDGSATMRRIYRLGLRASGCGDVLEAASCEEALALANDPIDCVIAGHAVPDADGPELVRRLRASQGARSARVLLVSDRNRRADVESAIEAGVDGYLLKPFDLDALKTRIDRMLGAVTHGDVSPTTLGDEGPAAGETAAENGAEGTVEPEARAA